MCIRDRVIDDVNGVTLVSASSLDKSFEGKGGNIEAARKVGQAIGKLAAEKNITEAAFDLSLIHISLEGTAGLSRLQRSARPRE